MLYGVSFVCVCLNALASAVMCLCVLFEMYCVMMHNSSWGCFVCACVCACVRFVLICLRMLLVIYCVMLCGLFVVFACCFVWACVLQQSCLCV